MSQTQKLTAQDDDQDPDALALEQDAQDLLEAVEKELEKEPAKPVLKLPVAEAGGDVPEWAMLPANLKVPREQQVIFIRFPAAMTATPGRGDRQCIVWALTDGEEKLANDRSAGNSGRAAAEYTKQFLRAVDGVVVDWSKPRGPGSVDEFYRVLGPKGRNLLMRVYTQLHLATEEETRDFFESCIAVRTVS